MFEEYGHAQTMRPSLDPCNMIERSLTPCNMIERSLTPCNMEKKIPKSIECFHQCNLNGTFFWVYNKYSYYIAINIE